MITTLVATPDPDGMSWPYVVAQSSGAFSASPANCTNSQLVITWDVPPCADIPND